MSTDGSGSRRRPFASYRRHSTCRAASVSATGSPISTSGSSRAIWRKSIASFRTSSGRRAASPSPWAQGERARPSAIWPAAGGIRSHLCRSRRRRRAGAACCSAARGRWESRTERPLPASPRLRRRGDLRPGRVCALPAVAPEAEVRPRRLRTRLSRFPGAQVPRPSVSRRRARHRQLSHRGNRGCGHGRRVSHPARCGDVGAKGFIRVRKAGLRAWSRCDRRCACIHRSGCRGRQPILTGEDVRGEAGRRRHPRPRSTLCSVGKDVSGKPRFRSRETARRPPEPPSVRASRRRLLRPCPRDIHRAAAGGRGPRGRARQHPDGGRALEASARGRSPRQPALDAAVEAEDSRL